MTYTYRRTWPDKPDKQDFEFCYTGHAAGRTYEDRTAHGVKWYWSVYGINMKGVVPDDIERQGLADSFDDARDKFKASFGRLLTAGNVRLPENTDGKA